MPGKEAWERSAGRTAGSEPKGKGGEPMRLPAHHVDNAITDLEIELNLDDLTAPLDSEIAGEPVSAKRTPSNPNPVTDLADNYFVEDGNIFFGVVFSFGFVLVGVLLILALVWSSLICVGLAVLVITFLCYLIGKSDNA